MLRGWGISGGQYTQRHHSVRKDMNVNDHKRLSNITLRHTLK
jgi:hypothetical protein